MAVHEMMIFHSLRSEHVERVDEYFCANNMGMAEKSTLNHQEFIE